jgi:DNA-binding NarL/FixJ family response regulator
MITIGVFEDHPMMARSLEETLAKQSNISVLFSVTDKNSFLSSIKEKQPDILLLDLLAKDVRGLEIFELVSEDYPSVKMIAFTSLSSPVLIENLLGLRVRGYVNKNQEEGDLIEAIRVVSNDETYLPEEYRFLSKKYHLLKSTILSEREIQIVQLISREFTTSEIAAHLSLSTNTIENHRSKIFNKLNVKNVAGMVREAAKLGYL